MHFAILRIEVTLASRGLSAIAELLVLLGLIGALQIGIVFVFVVFVETARSKLGDWASYEQTCGAVGWAGRTGRSGAHPKLWLDGPQFNGPTNN